MDEHAARAEDARIIRKYNDDTPEVWPANGTAAADEAVYVLAEGEDETRFPEVATIPFHNHANGSRHAGTSCSRCEPPLPVAMRALPRSRPPMALCLADALTAAVEAYGVTTGHVGYLLAYLDALSAFVMGLFDLPEDAEDCVRQAITGNEPIAQAVLDIREMTGAAL